MTYPDYRNKAAIAGFGVTKVTRRAERPVGILAIEASLKALNDAGVTPSDIDGIACGTSLPMWGSTSLQRGVDMVDTTFLTDHFGIDPTWASNSRALPTALTDAAAAIAAGEAKCVLVNRTLHNPASGYNRFANTIASGEEQWTAPYGNSAPTIGFALVYQEYQRRYGARRRDMAPIVSELRSNVQTMPEAYWYGSPLRIEDYMESRLIADPMCIHDADIPVDGSASFVLTTAARADDLPNRPVFVTDWAERHTSNWRFPGTFGTLTGHQQAGASLSSRLWRSSRWNPTDVQVVELYDGFSPLIYLWMESLGLCDEGEAWSCLRGGLVNPLSGTRLLTGGGATGWGRMHGFPQIIESYLQLAQRAGTRQLSRAETALAAYATPDRGVLMLFSADRSS